jgi:hypothetical protein
MAAMSFARPRLPLAALAATATFACAAARAEEPQRPTLAVLRTAPPGPDEEREERFVMELKLSLDGFDVALADPATPGFTALPMKEKLDEVRARVEPLRAAATIWLESASPKTVLLNVVALGTGRAFIRVVEVADGPGAERELAIAAGELLGQVYMLSAPPRPKPVNAAVQRVVEKAAAVAAPARRDLFDLSTFLTMDGAASPYERSWLRAGGGVALELQPAAGLLLRLGVSVVAGPFADPRDGALSGYAIAPELGLGYLWRLGKLRLGPIAGAGAVRSAVALALGGGSAHAFSWWSFRGTLGLRAQLDLGPSVSVYAEPRAGAWSNTRRFERSSDGETALHSPIIDVGAALGICYNF